MNRYANNQTKYTKPSGFMERYASSLQEKQEKAKINEKDEFDVDYKKGSVRIACAQKFMNLHTAGLDMFVDDLSVVWKKEGDRIVRQDNDLSWVDKLLSEEGTN
jgi:hypothetical protein